ncbi:MAG: hypothetical protein IT372_28040 [Polyangiaceae bacterium]|nr:hypothetical protein [Polyangiaceae bacterium]
MRTNTNIEPGLGWTLTRIEQKIEVPEEVEEHLVNVVLNEIAKHRKDQERRDGVTDLNQYRKRLNRPSAPTAPVHKGDTVKPPPSSVRRSTTEDHEDQEPALSRPCC